MAAAPKKNPLCEMADELGALEKEFAPLKLKAARIEALRKAMRAQFASKSADKEFVVTGEHYVVTVGAAGLERTVDQARLAKAIGSKQFCHLARMTLAQVDALVPPAIALDVVSQDRTGHRSLKIHEKGVAA